MPPSASRRATRMQLYVSPPPPMTVCDLHVPCVAALETKAHALLIVDAHAPSASEVLVQPLQAVAEGARMS